MGVGNSGVKKVGWGYYSGVKRGMWRKGWGEGVEGTGEIARLEE